MSMPNHPPYALQRTAPPARKVGNAKTGYTTSEVAKIVNRSIDTIRRWRKEGSVVPSKEREMGDLIVHVYTPEDVQKALDYASTVKPGRPRGRKDTDPMKARRNHPSNAKLLR